MIMRPQGYKHFSCLTKRMHNLTVLGNMVTRLIHFFREGELAEYSINKSIFPEYLRNLIGYKHNKFKFIVTNILFLERLCLNKYSGRLC